MKRPTTLNAIGLALLASTLAGWHEAPVACHAAWLIAWWWCLGIVLGAASTGLVHRLSGGAWGEAIAPSIAALAGRLPWLLLAALPWVLGWPCLYAWARPDVRQALGLEGFKAAWLSTGFFEARLLGYALCWLGLSRLVCGSPGLRGVKKSRAALALMAHVFVTSLAAVDIIMSLMPRWRSTGFGLIMLMSQALGGCAMLIWRVDAAMLGSPPARDRREGEGEGEAGPRAMPAPTATVLGRDLGNLLLMYVMAWGYLAFMEFLIIWAENLPDEIAWYVPRLQTGWVGLSRAIVAMQLGVPTLALLWRAVKDRPARLRAVAALVLVANALYAVWLVAPSLPGLGMPGWWLMPVTMAGLALALFGGLRRPSGPVGGPGGTAPLAQASKALDTPQGSEGHALP